MPGIATIAFVMCVAQAQPAPSADIQSVSWMAGHWIGVETEDLSEEIWLPPAADGMVGMWRWASKGKLRLFELLTISREGDGLALRLRHFRPDLSALEETDKPFVLPLIESAPNEAVFAGTGSDNGPLRITYRRVGERLEASVEKGATKSSFTYRLKK
ncbi:MAG: hypothetical protein A3H96_27280 [Acidobacteria bacterium RIFCSPLOWO2_02_FULL_67_36]|nr:MAG: hypothetical protein A3H96_27280 [Acidobacteria bacterium RIFCSPLOWO2_02_FULL_67_36]OFW24568.1 MAG: hypothetical protein A3G21_18625 [Acidobacteria bacterium RIFCSPLOWO2_12_FULL_66_21]